MCQWHVRGPVYYQCSTGVASVQYHFTDKNPPKSDSTAPIWDRHFLAPDLAPLPRDPPCRAPPGAQQRGPPTRSQGVPQADRGERPYAVGRRRRQQAGGARGRGPEKARLPAELAGPGGAAARLGGAHELGPGPREQGEESDTDVLNTDRPLLAAHGSPPTADRPHLIAYHPPPTTCRLLTAACRWPPSTGGLPMAA